MNNKQNRAKRIRNFGARYFERFIDTFGGWVHHEKNVPLKRLFFRNRASYNVTKMSLRCLQNKTIYITLGEIESNIIENIYNKSSIRSIFK